VAAPPPVPDSAAPIITRVFGPGWRFVRGFTGTTDINDPGHHGWDIAAATGTPVYALTSGKVSFAEFAGNDRNATGATNPAKSSAAWTSGGGNVVAISRNSFDYDYAHLDTILVKEGQSVVEGQQIGTVGATGDATGPHLHFAIEDRTNKKWVNPTAFLTEWNGDVGGPDARPKNTTNGLLSFWGNITFPEGHVLTAADVDDIMHQLSDQGAFGNIVIVNNTAAALTRGVLLAYVGQPWNDALATRIQGSLGQAAALTPGAFDPTQGIAPFLGALIDPGHWAMFLAIIGGALMIAIGGWKVLSNSGSKA
jgi:murein DD-endopeptidase MepM/ murein hydrolase activator NlpD